MMMMVLHYWEQRKVIIAITSVNISLFIFAFILTIGPSNTSESDFDSRRVLMDVHNMLHCLIRRVEGTEKELKSIKVRMSTPSSDSSSSNHKQKVPVAVKVRYLCS